MVSVIDLHLTKAGTPYLVGDKCTYADLSFITWAGIVPMLGIDVFEGGTKNLKYKAWMDRLQERDSVKKVLADKAEAGKAHA